MSYARAGIRAWDRHLDALELGALATLEVRDAPGPELDTQRPWWCMALTTDPVFLKTDERSSCEMLMGLCPIGSPGVDWPRVVRRAPEIFAQMAHAAGSAAILHLSPLDLHLGNPSTDSGSRQVRLGGRCYVAMPAYQEPDPWESLAFDDKAFDRRRARRQSRRPPPESWVLLHGHRAARDLWSSGFSPAHARGHRFLLWGASTRALALAMLESGAARVERAPGFFAKFPSSMDGENLAPIDSTRGDDLRQRWDIDRCARPGSPRRRLSI